MNQVSVSSTSSSEERLCRRSVRWRISPAVLGAAQEQDGEDGTLAWLHAQHVLDAVLEFRGAAAEDFLDEVFLGESAEGFRYLLSGEAGDGVAAGALVAGDDEGIVGERVAVGREDLFL